MLHIFAERELHELTENAYIQETSINNSFVREGVFYHLNEWFTEPEI